LVVRRPIAIRHARPRKVRAAEACTDQILERRKRALEIVDRFDTGADGMSAVGRWRAEVVRTVGLHTSADDVHTVLAQVLQYEGNDLRIVAVSWDYTDNGVGPNGPWHVIPVNTGGNFTSNTTFYALPSLSDTNILVDLTASDLELDDARSSDDEPDDWGVLGSLSSGWGTILGEDYNIVNFKSDSNDLATFGGRVNQYAGSAYDIAERLWIEFHTMPFQKVYNQTRTFQRIIASRNLTLQAPWGNGERITSSFPTLLIGGYDANLFFNEPALVNSSQPNGLVLRKLDLSVKSGDIAFQHPEDFTDGLWLRDPIVSNLAPTDNPWAVYLEPSLPYIYLPRDTCHRLAKYLPVTFDSNLQLYLWDTKNSSDNYTQILTSPHFVDFDLLSTSPDAVDTTISVPLALLNLTLTTPILNGSDGETSKQYFPCRPLDTPSNTAVLGRAFLQAAYLAVNWENGMMAVGQAPGPDHKVRADNMAQGLTMIRGGEWNTFGLGKASLMTVTGNWDTVLVDSWSSLLTPLKKEKTDVKKSDGVVLRGGKWGLGLLLGGVAGASML
ncbi:hypothetical protein N0V95_007757, partial [Ascochyta clinopodiicola]